MDNKKVAKEIVKIAKLISGASDFPIQVLAWSKKLKSSNRVVVSFTRSRKAGTAIDVRSAARSR